MNGDNQIQTEVVAETAGLPTPLELELDSQKAISRISAISRVIEGCAKVSIQRTNPKDWVKMGDNYYLQATGAQKIRPIWGIYYRDRHVAIENYPDGSYGYIVTGKVGSKVLDQLYGEVVVEIDGGRNAADPFFTKGDREPDPMDVRKAALANWEARAVTALLGLKNMTAEDLKNNGVNFSAVTSVDYKKGSEGGGKTGTISQAQSKRLWAICQKNGVTEDMLKIHLKERYHLDTSKDIKRSDYDKICTWAERGGIEPSQRELGEEG